MFLIPRRLSAFLLAGVLAVGSSVAAQAQDIPEEADFLLWCGSAFYFLGILVDDDAEAESFLAAGTALSDMGADALMSLGMGEEDIIATIEAYDARVVADFENDTDLPFDAEACIVALEL